MTAPVLSRGLQGFRAFILGTLRFRVLGFRVWGFSGGGGGGGGVGGLNAHNKDLIGPI